MLKSIIIAVVVAIVVWALSFDFFFTYKGTVLSFVVAAVAGLIAGLLFTKITPKIGIQIVAVAAIILVANFIVSKFFVSPPVCLGKQPVLKCGTADVEPDCFIAHKKTSFYWDKSNISNNYTVTIDDFKKKYWGFPVALKSHPLDKDSYSAGGTLTKIYATVQDEDGYFKYRITCSQPGMPDEVYDPMIKVP